MMYTEANSPPTPTFRPTNRVKKAFRSATSQQWFGFAILATLLIFSFLAPHFVSVDGAEQDLGAILTSPNAEHWLGTDHFGRSMWVRLADAIALSFGLAALCVLTASTAGIALGVLSAWFPTRFGKVVELLTTILLALPGLVLVLIFAAIVPGSFWMLYFAIALIQWVEYYRVVRAICQPLIHSPEMEASQLMGFGRWYCFKRHLLPAILPQVLTIAAFGAANAILMMASLGFVYVGIQPPLAELGLMTVELFPYYSDAPWLLAEPLVSLAAMVLGCQLLGRRNA
ncbi:ABC transporter permease [Marinomonas balearica]|uniref:Peptide/nickel transport system permease protein n=1 Tax=Marinomonas balearica TaxID=491947 RepID=A0A4R6M7G1_9GAMM|nr:ABC transporter permease [Marinomonas balearica]TDO97313.1 peptide/nickel transport system permease protein [Marinomonas balearica]